MWAVPFVGAAVYLTSYWLWYPNGKDECMIGLYNGPKERVNVRLQ